MKMRMGATNADEKKKGLACSTEGQLPLWELKGFVQEVTENRKYHEDYIKFCIRKPDDPQKYELFAVTLPHDVGVELVVGDRVYMRGTIRTWQIKDSAGKVTGRKIELVCVTVEEWDD